MGFFKNIGKALGKVGKGVAKGVGAVVKTAGGLVGKVAHGVVSNIPIVKNIYGMATNIVGKDLSDIGGGVANLVGSGFTALGSIGDKKKVTTATDSANAQEIHESLQVENGKTAGFTTNDHDNKLVSYNGTPSVGGMYITSTNTEASYDTNPILLPATVKSGVTNTTMVNALEQQGINTGAVQMALTGEAPKGKKVNLESILELINGTSNVVKDTFIPSNLSPAGANNNVLIIGGILGALGLGYLVLNNK